MDNFKKEVTLTREPLMQLSSSSCLSLLYAHFLKTSLFGNAGFFGYTKLLPIFLYVAFPAWWGEEREGEEGVPLLFYSLEREREKAAHVLLKRVLSFEPFFSASQEENKKKHLKTWKKTRMLLLLLLCFYSLERSGARKEKGAAEFLQFFAGSFLPLFSYYIMLHNNKHDELQKGLWCKSGKEEQNNF